MALGQMLLFPLEAPPAAGAVVSPANVPAAKPEKRPQKRPQDPSSKPSLDQLRAQVQRIQSRRLSSDSDPEPCFSVGGAVLEAMLPHRGLRRGTIVQWIGDIHGSGASSLSLMAAAHIARSEISGGKPLVIFDSGKHFYPPAAISLGVPANRMVIVHKRRQHSHADMIWALDQALRCDAVAAVWAEIGPWLNDRDARRLQLAAEAGGTVGLFVRPEAVRGRPSFADISWHVSPLQEQHPASSAGSANRRLRVQIDRCRGGAQGAVATIEIKANPSGDSVVACALPTPSSQQVPATEYVSVAEQPSVAQQRKGRHETTLASDLAHRLAHPTPAKRHAADEPRRGTRHAS